MLADADAWRDRLRHGLHRGRDPRRRAELRRPRLGPRGRCRVGAGCRRRRHRSGRQRLGRRRTWAHWPERPVCTPRCSRSWRRSVRRGTTDGPQGPRGPHHSLSRCRRRPGGQGHQLRKPARRRRSRRTRCCLRPRRCRRTDLPGCDGQFVGPCHHARGRQTHRRAGVHPVDRRRRCALGGRRRRAVARRRRQGRRQHRRHRPARTAGRTVPPVRVAVHRVVRRRADRARRVSSRHRRDGRSPPTADGAAPGSTPSNGPPAAPNWASARSCSTRWTSTAPRPGST